MLIFGMILCIAGIGFFCWLLFTLAVYALPFFAGLSAGLAAFHAGSGVIRAFLVAVLAGGATLAVGRIAFAMVRSSTVRTVIALLFAGPAAIAGFQATLGIAQIGIPSEAWREVIAVVGALLIGGVAFARMSLFVPPALGRGVGGGPAGSALPAGAPGEG